MSYLWDSAVRLIGSAPLAAECPADPELGAWFLSPTQHLVEMLVASSASAYVAYIGYSMYKSSSLSQHSRQLQQQPQSAQAEQRLRHTASAPSLSPTSSSLYTHVLVFLLSLSWAILFIHKSRIDRLWFLLQPCHVLHLLLIYTVTLPPSSPRAIFLFNLYLHLLFSPFLGLVAADLSCYKQPLELANWCAQHALLLLTPLIALLPPASYPLLTGTPFFLLCFSLEVLYHALVLSPLALYSTFNLNYVLCPPAGLLASFGQWYRLVMTAACAVLSLIVRYGMVEAWRWAVQRGLGKGMGPDVVEVEVKQGQQQGSGENGGPRLVLQQQQQQEDGGDGEDGQAAEDGSDAEREENKQTSRVTRPQARRSRKE